MSTGSIRDMFFEECDELLETMSDGLADMEAGTGSEDTIHSVFRSVHSIKGGAGAFAMERVVAFAHRFETVMDQVRDGRIEADQALIGVLQRAGDHLGVLIEDARQDLEEPRDDTAALLASLDTYLGGPSDEDEPLEFAAISFDAAPLTLDLSDLEATDAPDTACAPSGFCISFAPKSDLFLNGHEPILLFAALEELGELTVTANTDGVPELSKLNWKDAYLEWRLELKTSEPEESIHEIFEFVEGLCDLKVSVLGPDTAQLVAQEDPAPKDSAPNSSETAEISGAKPQAAAIPGINAKGQANATSAETSKAKDTKPIGPKATLRVDLDRVDRLINTVGELIINQAMIAQRVTEAKMSNGTDLQSELDAYQALAREIQEGVMAIRAQPVKPLFQRMSRIVREAMDATGKKVKLVTDGEATEIDKTVVERIADPLTHMIRNAVDHGIETPEDRLAAGKSEAGTIHLSASHRSGSVVIEIRDDGAGLDRPRILQTAIQKGLVAENADLSEAEIDHLLFMPGFSTAAEISNLSGRGVGMDVVKNSISSLGGRISISSEPGHGSLFSISLPLTLAVLDGMVVHVAGQVMIVPLSAILETVRPDESDLHSFGINTTMLRIRDTHVPIYDVATQLALRTEPVDYTEQVLLLVESEGHGKIVLAVDDISDQRQVVIKGMQANYGTIPGISAATILGDGKIALILDPETLTARTAPLVSPKTSQEVLHAASA